MNNTPNNLDSLSNSDESWANIGANIPFDEDMARRRVQADKNQNASVESVEFGPIQYDEYGNFRRERIPKSPNYHEEDPETQTIFVPTPEVANANATLQAQTEKERRIQGQSAKIVESFTTGRQITDVDGSGADEQGYTAFYEQLNNHQLTSANESQFLQSLATPLHRENGFAKTYGELDSEHEFKILAFASGNGFGKNIPTSTSDLQTILEKYPTPIEFQAVEDKLLDGIRRAPNNSPSKVAEYQKDFESFKHKVYGKRQEYHEAWQKLERDAKSYQVLHTPHEESPEEYAQKVRDGIYAEYIYPSAGQEPASQVVIKPRDPDTARPEPKKGVFGKLFGRKK